MGLCSFLLWGTLGFQINKKLCFSQNEIKPHDKQRIKLITLISKSEYSLFNYKLTHLFYYWVQFSIDEKDEAEMSTVELQLTRINRVR